MEGLTSRLRPPSTGKYSAVMSNIRYMKISLTYFLCRAPNDEQHLQGFDLVYASLSQRVTPKGLV